MHQILFTIPGLGVKVYGFGLMLTLAMLGAMNLAAWRARKENLDGEQVFDLAIWVLLGGLLGARLFFVIQYRKSMESIWDVFKIWNGGIVLYGSIIGGTIALIIYRKLRPFPLRPMLDALAPALALGIALGRIGCFLNGCCYGDLCSLPWAVTFPKPTAPWLNHFEHGLIEATVARSLPIHPTQIYSAIDGLVILALLTCYFPLRKRDGEVTAILMICYPITRFLIEQLRNDEAGIVGGLTISQAISVGFLLMGIVYWIRLQRSPAQLYANQHVMPSASGHGNRVKNTPDQVVG